MTLFIQVCCVARERVVSGRIENNARFVIRAGAVGDTVVTRMVEKNPRKFVVRADAV
jgi:hypothetical protein